MKKAKLLNPRVEFYATLDSLFQYVLSEQVLNGHRDILLFKRKIDAVRKLNPKLVCKVWKEQINPKFGTQIMNLDHSFFIRNDFSSDISAAGEHAADIMKGVESLREPVSLLSETIKQTIMMMLKDITFFANEFNE